MIKMAKFDTLFMTKMAEKRYPLEPNIPIQLMYGSAPSHPPASGVSQTKQVKDCGECGNTVDCLRQVVI